jgi:ketosteroid isomerase-like protein
MVEQTNTQIVQEAYACFARGDIPGVLSRLADDVDWQAVYGVAPYVPTGGRRAGKAAVAEFFTTLSKSIAFSRFEPREYIAQDDKVVVLGHYEGTALPTGRTVSSDWVMIFTLRNGTVIHFREYADSAGVNAAYQP